MTDHPDMAAPKLRVYYLPNGDGVNSFLVAARNQREACHLLRSSVYHFRQYGGRRTDDPAMVAVAMSEPGRVWKKRITFAVADVQPWVYA